MEPIIQKLADILQVTTDKVTEMYPVLVQEATWYTVIQNTKQFMGWALFLSFCIALVIGMISVAASESDQDALERVMKILKVETIAGGILAAILAVASIFGPLLYPNLNLFTHLFK